MTREPNDPEAAPDGESRRRIEEQELLEVLSEVQRDQAEGAIDARPPKVLRRLRLPLECLGGILFGLNIAAFAIAVNFVLFNYLLHLEF
jgi:hypothetical protein